MCGIGTVPKDAHVSSHEPPKPHTVGPSREKQHEDALLEYPVLGAPPISLYSFRLNRAHRRRWNAP